MNVPFNSNGRQSDKARKKAKLARGQGSGLISFPFMRRLRRSFPNKDCPRVVLLQGPVGSFFRRAQEHLNANGFDAWRVRFNAGDRLYSRGDKTLDFIGNVDSWRLWFSEIIREHGFDAVVLFGSERLVQRAGARRLEGEDA